MSNNHWGGLGNAGIPYFAEGNNPQIRPAYSAGVTTPGKPHSRASVRSIPRPPQNAKRSQVLRQLKGAKLLRFFSLVSLPLSLSPSTCVSTIFVRAKLGACCVSGVSSHSLLVQHVYVQTCLCIMYLGLDMLDVAST